MPRFSSFLASLTVAVVTVVALTAPVKRALAQVVAPPAFSATEGPTIQASITQNFASTYLVQYSGAQLSGLVVGQQITALRFRLDNSLAAHSLNYASYNVQLSQAANPITGMSQTFAANQLNPVTVFSAPLGFDVGDMPFGSAPNAFGPEITFTTPYTYQGGDLVLYFTHGANTLNNGSIALDGVLPLNTNTGYRAIVTIGENASAGNLAANPVITQFVIGGVAAATPEPGTLILLGVAIGMAGLLTRRKR